MNSSNYDFSNQLAQEMQLNAGRVGAVLRLLNEGATVPFIARYRKEATGEMDEVQIRSIQERQAYLTELEDRRASILESIESQGKLTDELARKIKACTTKTALEDLYLPYKKKRRTRATMAKEKGLEPLADLIWAQSSQLDPQAEAQAFINAELGVESTDDALKGARDIMAERMTEDADIRAFVRENVSESGVFTAEASSSVGETPTKFQDFYEFSEKLATVPSHRFLAVRRGEREGILRSGITIDDENLNHRILTHLNWASGSAAGEQLQMAVADGFKRLLFPSVSSEVLIDVKMRADREAVDVFASNLKNLLLAAPLGGRPVIGIDPGLRTGCKCVAVDSTGRFLEHTTIYLTRGAGAKADAKVAFAAFMKKHNPVVIAVGNGTGGRETESFVKSLIRELKITDTIVVLVNEAGASIYSASDIAREEFPQLDLTIRGAISIARRLQDPLAELVKIEPKAIGVGQYQHDVHQPLLTRKLDEVVEDCVNKVGVEVNTASAPLLSRVAGIGPKLATKVVAHRESTGPFAGRMALLKVSGLGPRTFEQAAGFLRVAGGEHPLDASAVHPERYGLVEKMAADLELDLKDLISNQGIIARIDVKKYVGEGANGVHIGEPTLRDILAELQKPGRDPRETFEPPKFRDDVHEMSDLNPGMVLEGVVTNVAAFGAFVDIGVHQDGLVHISQLADHFVKNPHEVVKVGDKLKVRVLEVDLARKRISLSARSESAPNRTPGSFGGNSTAERGHSGAQSGGNRGGRGHHSQGGQRGGQRRPQRQNQHQNQGRGGGQNKRKQGAGKLTNNPFADALKNWGK